MLFDELLVLQLSQKGKLGQAYDNVKSLWDVSLPHVSAMICINIKLTVESLLVGVSLFCLMY